MQMGDARLPRGRGTARSGTGGTEGTVGTGGTGLPALTRLQQLLSKAASLSPPAAGRGSVWAPRSPPAPAPRLPALPSSFQPGQRWCAGSGALGGTLGRFP